MKDCWRDLSRTNDDQIMINESKRSPMNDQREKKTNETLQIVQFFSHDVRCFIVDRRSKFEKRREASFDIVKQIDRFVLNQQEKLNRRVLSIGDSHPSVFTFGSGISFRLINICRRRSKNSVNIFLICAIFGWRVASNF